MPLTDIACRNVKPTDKQVKLPDKKGLFLLVAPSGGKWWRFRYMIAGREKMLSLGVYPDVSLKLARERRDEARRLLAEGIDPGEKRKKEKSVAPVNDPDSSFEMISRQWIKKMSPTWSETHTGLVTSRLERDVFPAIGNMTITDIKTPHVLELLDKMMERGVTVSMHRVKQIVGMIFRFAIASGRAEYDPTTALTRALTPVKEKHHPTITDPALLSPGFCASREDFFQAANFVKDSVLALRAVIRAVMMDR
ncbi:MAG: integrase arm-type DNA-binding domain-containing protein, partial [Magnetococcus sp. YQC-9]